MNNSDVTLFFTSSKTIKGDIKKIPNPKIGCTTAGTIDRKMMETLVQTTLNSEDFLIETVKMKNLGIPLLYAKEIMEKSTRILKEKKSLVCIVLNDGLSQTEELVQSVLSVALPRNTTIVGASSGDDLDFKETYCCVDDDVFKGAVVVLIGTDLKYYVHKENLYVPTDKMIVITEAEGRVIKKINGRPAVEEYARLNGVNASKIDSIFSEHPIGLKYNDEVFICSPQKQNSDGSISMYIEVLPGSIAYLLEPCEDYNKEMSNTVDTILSKGKPIFTFVSNCILRKALFSQKNMYSVVDSNFNKINAFGFTTYGEQLNAYHMNQTMVSITFYK